jgi:hypothetical protein
VPPSWRRHISSAASRKRFGTSTRKSTDNAAKYHPEDRHSRRLEVALLPPTSSSGKSHADQNGSTKGAARPPVGPASRRLCASRMNATSSSDPTAGPRPATDRRHDVYVVVWMVHQCVQLSQQGFLFGPWRAACAGVLALLGAVWMLSPRHRHYGFGIALIVRNGVRLWQMPFLWDSEYWCLLTDVAVLLLAWEHRGALDHHHHKNDYAYPRTIRYQWAVLYLAAGVWKLNTGFLSASTSCGAIFSAQVVGLPLPGLPVALLEVAIGLLFLLRPRYGIWLCLAFHAAVAVTPKPNGVPTFSLIAATRLVAFAEGGLEWNWISPLVSLVLFEDPAAQVFFALAPMIVLSKARPKEGEAEVVSEANNDPKRRGNKRMRLLVGATCLYVALPILGLQDIGAPTMFGNLKVHGGSNHLLLPTGLLQQWFATTTTALGGGVVRIEHTDSLFLQQLYPGEFPLDAALVEGLQNAGHVGREFGPKARRILGAEIRSRMPVVNPLVPYTIPFLELRRMLQEAPRPFSISYTYLGIQGDERWRRSKGHYTVQWELDETPSATKGVCLGGDCDEAMDPTIPPPWWALKWMLFASYPVLMHADTDEILCNY